MKTYLQTLIQEKGSELDQEINIEGHYGITYEDLINFIDGMKDYHQEIKNTLVKIDFHNGDVFHYLDFLAKGMVDSLGY